MSEKKPSSILNDNHTFFASFADLSFISNWSSISLRINQREYIVTLKDGNLPSVWEEVRLLLPIEKDNKLKVTQAN
ncbi:MAG: hypothetical protein ABIG69_19505 [Bacteroidota bacterium]